MTLIDIRILQVLGGNLRDHTGPQEVGIAGVDTSTTVDVSMRESDLMLESSLALAESVKYCLGPVAFGKEDAV